MMYPPPTKPSAAMAYASAAVFARVLLGVVGGIVVLYYIYALVKLLADGGGDYAAPVVMSLLLWLVAEIMTLLPLTKQAMRQPGAALRH